MHAPDVLGLGITGKALTDLERDLLRNHVPFAIVLFGRNVGTADELRELVREIKSTASRPPLILIDEEGGRVDRLRHLIPGLPSAEVFAEGENGEELATRFGRVVGRALRWFDIDVDLAPVVDVRGGESPKGLERRTFGGDPVTVIALGGAFMRGLHREGTAACLKHFPGIGIGSADPHYGATVIDVSLGELLARDLMPFSRLGNEAASIMIGHGTYPRIDPEALPATLSKTLSRDLLRTTVGFDGIAMSDDMEMHAVSDLGTYESVTERALMAGNDAILFCSHVERAADVEAHLARRVTEDPAVRARFEEAATRCERFRRHCDELRANAVAPAASFDEVIDDAAAFLDELHRSRPRTAVIPEVERRKDDRTPKGRTGREEWT